MGQIISIAYELTADASREGELTLYTVQAAKKFKLTNIYVHFPAGTYFELRIAIMKGIYQVAPHSGVYVGDANVITDKSNHVFESGESVTLYYKNTNTTEARKAFVLLTGELE